MTQQTQTDSSSTSQTSKPKRKSSRSTSPKVKYYASLSYTNKDGKKINFVTQLYQVGLYLCISEDGVPHQSSTTPTRFAKAQKEHIAQMDKEKWEYKLGSLKIARKVNGLWEEVTDGETEASAA